MRQGNLLLPAAVLILVGSIGFLQISRQARFAAFHTVDVLQLLASGMCFGVALAAILFTLVPHNRT